MSHTPLVTRIIANLAALAGIVLLAGLAIDHAAGWLGYRPMAFCALLPQVIASAYGIGIFLTSIGVIVWGVSLGSTSGLGLALGGMLLFALPRYLSVACIL